MSSQFGEDIVTDGLLFYVDANNKKSYLGSGTVVDDLVGTSTGTLNNATFDTAGYFDFDGNDDWISFTAPTNAPTGDEARTISCWLQMGHATNRMHVFGYGTGTSYRTFSLEISSYGSTDRAVALMAWDLIWEGPNTLLTIDTWHYCTIAYAGNTVNTSTLKIYVDGQDAGLSRTYGGDNVTLNTPAENFKAGLRPTGTDLDFTGYLSAVHFYNRQLTAEEVEHNFNAQRDIYGV